MGMHAARHGLASQRALKHRTPRRGGEEGNARTNDGFVVITAHNEPYGDGHAHQADDDVGNVANRVASAHGSLSLKAPVRTTHSPVRTYALLFS